MPRTVAITDIPAVIAAIQQLETDAARRFEFDEIFGGSEGETLADIANLPPETLNRISQLNALSAESAQRFADQKDRLDALNISFQHSTANVAGAFLPVMEDVSDNLLPIIEGFGDWAAENEHVVRGLLASAVATTALVGAIFAITKATALLNAALAVRAALSGPAGWVALGVAAGVGVGAYAISGGFGDQADEAEGETSRLADAQQETADLLRGSTGPGSAPQPVRDRDLIAEYGDDKDRLENILEEMDCRIRGNEAPDGTPARANWGVLTDEDSTKFFNPNAGVSQRQVNADIRRYDQERARAGLAGAAERRTDLVIDEFRALLEASGVTAGHVFPPRQLIDPDTGVGSLARISEEDLKRAIIDIRAAFPDETQLVAPSTVGRYATGIDNQPRLEPLEQNRLPPHLRNVPFEARGDTYQTFNIDGSEDPEMTAAAVIRQINRQADQDHF